MKITKKEREDVRLKYGGKCSYCGCDLQKGFHVDHIQPAFHTWSDEDISKYLKVKRGEDTIENYNPSCPRCNRWKATFSIEQFRTEISLQVERLKRDSPQFRMALDYGLVEEKDIKVKFYFEKYDEENLNFL